MVKELEKDIQNAICEYLSYKHYFFWRQNNLSVFNGKEFRALPKYAMKGIPDIILIKPKGIVMFLEVKTSKGKLSDGQLQFQKKCILTGVDYCVVRSVEDVIREGL